METKREFNKKGVMRGRYERKRKIYLDNAATTFPKLPEIQDVIKKYCKSFNQSPNRTNGKNILNDVREKILKYFDASDGYEVAFVPTATIGMNIVIKTLSKDINNQIITTNCEHHCVYRPLEEFNTSYKMIEYMDDFAVDFLTVSPYLGLDSITPFIEECKENDKGIFILVKTSNPSSSDIQDKVDSEGKTIYQNVAEFVKKQADEMIGETGYSPIGAVVGATFPGEALSLRKIMNNSIFLVPGYGAQGATAKDVMNCFNDDGLGALINSSRGIIYAYRKQFEVDVCSVEDYKRCTREATIKMKEDIILSLEEFGKSFK